MNIKSIFSLLLCIFFSYNAPAMQALGEHEKPITLKRKRKNAESMVEEQAKRRRVNLQRSGELHPKVNKHLLQAGYLIAPSLQPQALMMHQAHQKFSRHDQANPFGVSLVGGKDACFALHPGKKILGEGQRGKVKLAQVLSLHPDGPSAQHEKPCKVGDWIAIKIQDEDFENEEIEGLFRTKKLLIAKPFRYKAKDGSARFACPVRLVHGNTLAAELLKRDPQKKLVLEDFLAVAGDLNSSLGLQLHRHGMSFHDKNLENMIADINNKELTFIDYGNVYIFDYETTNYYQACDEDYILILAAIFDHLNNYDYDHTLQNNFWIFAYGKTVEYFTEYNERGLLAETSAFNLFCSFAQSLPPFLKAIYGPDENDWHNKDRRVIEQVKAYLDGDN